jgi:uncharacterized protein
LPPDRGFDVRVLPGELAIARLAPDEPLPGWAAAAGHAGAGGGDPVALHAVVRTPAELSVVCPDADVPSGAQAARGWRALAVAGPLDLALTGVLIALALPLARAGVAIFTVSTYDTDYLLVRSERLDEAVEALRAAGHRVAGVAAPG